MVQEDETPLAASIDQMASVIDAPTTQTSESREVNKNKSSFDSSIVKDGAMKVGPKGCEDEANIIIHMKKIRDAISLFLVWIGPLFNRV